MSDSIDHPNKTLLTLSQAAKTLPRINGRKIHTSTIWRWCRKGCHGIFLSYWRIGRTVVTTEGALNQFFRLLAENDSVLTQHTNFKPPIRKRRRRPADRQASIEQANQILRQAKILT
ncbi:MAG: DUF1580 domain-containing protein [Sedimentisphaerales bacterium]|nr:DUF1580 domain-containing protein [Sedimentisphaerales bacterium]